MSLTAYRSARKISETPRATEYRLMLQVTGELMAANESGVSGGALMLPLHRNREMWSVLAMDCATKGNSLPEDLRATIISLAHFVDRHTSAIMAGKESIDDLVEINRAVMAGLGSEQAH